ncbi:MULTISPECIES: AraC family transcriptional regulator [Nocardioides]|uniref:AraC family transcriptional regulator n=1 Tax=Nocardioides vastitatis TaxID=2568655 RepID=A0ABW0ZN55_9ACTN|nr:AraC family transcriptional regulator [Nocardioides sp.]THJ16042.1 helix-turn-helix domain-containing protein [Nocardioides sp.]
MTQTISEPLADVAFEERAFHWRSAVTDRLTHLKLQPTDRTRGYGSHQARDIGDLLMTDWRCPEMEGEHGSAMAAQEAECLLLFMVTTGRQIVQTQQDTVMLRPGAILLMSTRVTGKIVIPGELTKRTVRIPLTALAPYDTGTGVPDFLCLETAANPLARLTQDYLAGVDAQLGQMSAIDVEGARNALLALVAGMLRGRHGSDVSETDFLPFLRRQLENWIADHLTEGAIRVGDLAAAHNVAPRTVHRAFAATGDTMGAIVRAHRLAAARNDLVHTTASIAAIAHRWGFCDASHLGREFRREFSMSPGDYRAAHGIA